MTSAQVTALTEALAREREKLDQLWTIYRQEHSARENLERNTINLLTEASQLRSLLANPPPVLNDVPVTEVNGTVERGVNDVGGVSAADAQPCCAVNGVSAADAQRSCTVNDVDGVDGAGLWLDTGV